MFYDTTFLWYFEVVMADAEILLRGLERAFPNDSYVRALAEGPKKRIYAGIDPTAASLHVGHLSILLKLRDLQSFGHSIIVLIGDFTARIGDPTDKKSVRKTLTPDEVRENESLYLSQINKILPTSSIEVRHNSEWFTNLSLGELIPLAQEFTVGQMIERDMFQERIKKSEPIYLHEFLYPLLQGYDSVALSADGEVGGNDQTFNMLAGRTLQKHRGKDKFVLATKLLIDPSGNKMGKTEGNMVNLSDAPGDMYGKIMSWPDSILPLAFEILTRDPMDDVLGLIKDSPLKAKKRLAEAITTLVHGSDEGLGAAGAFAQKFVSKEITNDIPTSTVATGTLLVDVVIDAGLVSSRSEWRRLIEDGAVEEVNGEHIKNALARIDRAMTIRIGKARFLKINPN